MSPKFIFRENPQLFEINTAAWLFELSRKLGKTIRLGDVPSEEWDRLKDLGMDFVWLMGVWHRSQEGRKVALNSDDFRALFKEIYPDCTDEDIIGSCYSLSSFAPDPLIGTWQDIDYAHEALNQRGIGLILDFVPNHTGVDHHWLAEHPEYYVQVTESDYLKDNINYFPVKYHGRTLYIAHGRDPNFPSWTDTAQLNYFNPETRLAMIQRIREISRHCEGIRCDMAMLVLNDIFQKIWGWTNRSPVYPQPVEEFWIQVVREVPDLVYIAEAYWDTENTLQKLGFDFVYDKRLYDRLRDNPPQEVYRHLQADIEYQKKLVRFIENHDELRNIIVFGPHKALAAATLFSALPGMKLYFQGQMEGKQIRLPLQIRQSRQELVDLQIKTFYDKLLSVVNGDIFHSGSWKLMEVFPYEDVTSKNVIAYTWKLGDALALVMVNLSNQPSGGRITFQDAVSELTDYQLIEKLEGSSFQQSGKLMAHPGLIIKLSGYQSQIWEIRAANI
jgi:hypothetical protein